MLEYILYTILTINAGIAWKDMHLYLYMFFLPIYSFNRRLFSNLGYFNSNLCCAQEI